MLYKGCPIKSRDGKIFLKRCKIPYNYKTWNNVTKKIYLDYVTEYVVL